MSSFCESNELLPTTCHSCSSIDYSYNFSMERFSILDHFLVSSTMYNTCVNKVGVLHDVDNTSDHDPIFLEVNSMLTILVSLVVFLHLDFLGRRLRKVTYLSFVLIYRII